MNAFTPELQLQTLFVLNDEGRIVSTREPNGGAGPRFSLIRGRTRCAWAIRADVSDNLAAQLIALARQENHPLGTFGLSQSLQSNTSRSSGGGSIPDLRSHSRPPSLRRRVSY